MESSVRHAVPAGTSLIETFGYSPGHGVARFELHLARLTNSAAVLGFDLSVQMVRAQVAELVARLGGETPLRCRLTLAQDGEVALEVAPMPAAPTTPWVFRISPERVASDDLLMAHKTTQRALYDRWRGDLPDGVQEWLFVNERGEICEGTITNILVTTADGDRLTPALTSGCLPGVCRQSLLDSGAVKEAVLTLQDLAQARQIKVMNALRGALPARWDPACTARTVLL